MRGSRIMIGLLVTAGMAAFGLYGVRAVLQGWAPSALSGSTAGENHRGPASGGASHEPGLDLQKFLPPLGLGSERPVAVPDVEDLSLIFVDTRDPTVRPQIWINGKQVGQSPYMGQVRCDIDEPLQVEFEFANGTRVTKQAVCASEIRVTD